jgi:hypothetical protein
MQIQSDSVMVICADTMNQTEYGLEYILAPDCLRWGLQYVLRDKHLMLFRFG